MKILSVKHHRTPYGEIWFGEATQGRESFKWFYEPGSAVEQKRATGSCVELQEERDGYPGSWFNIARPSIDAERAILSAVRARLS
jgi:hypothetical protein